jgi:hypothetical protein
VQADERGVTALPGGGTRTSTSSDDVPLTWWQRSAAGPVITLSLPAYSSAAISCWSVVGVPVAAI